MLPKTLTAEAILLEARLADHVDTLNLNVCRELVLREITEVAGLCGRSLDDGPCDNEDHLILETAPGTAPIDATPAAQIRAWAQREGIRVPAKGRIPQEVRDAFAAQPVVIT